MIKNGQVSFLENGIVCIDRSVETEPSYYNTTPYELMENNDNNSE